MELKRICSNSEKNLSKLIGKEFVGRKISPCKLVPCNDLLKMLEETEEVDLLHKLLLSLSASLSLSLSASLCSSHSNYVGWKDE